MSDPIRELKARAEIFHRAVQSKSADALAKLRVLPELRTATDEALARFAETIQRKHALAVVALASGFTGWEHALRVLDGEVNGELDFGTLLYPRRGGGLNQWFTSYGEAAAERERTSGYLLAYKKHFFVAQEDLVEDLGLDPSDPDLEAIGRDFVRPRDASARRRLFGKLVAAMR
jgi:hypothetical protein